MAQSHFGARFRCAAWLTVQSARARPRSCAQGRSSPRRLRPDDLNYPRRGARALAAHLRPEPAAKHSRATRNSLTNETPTEPAIRAPVVVVVSLPFFAALGTANKWRRPLLWPPPEGRLDSRPGSPPRAVNEWRARALGGQVFVYEIKRVTSFGDSSSLFFARRRLPLRASRFDAARDQGIVNYTLVVVVVSFHAGAFHHHVDADAWRSRRAKIRPPPQRIERRSQTTKGREY